MTTSLSQKALPGKVFGRLYTRAQSEFLTAVNIPAYYISQFVLGAIGCIVVITASFRRSKYAVWTYIKREELLPALGMYEKQAHMPYFQIYPLNKNIVRSIDTNNMAQYEMSEQAAKEAALKRSRSSNYAIAVSEIHPVDAEKRHYERKLRYLVHRGTIFIPQDDTRTI